MNCTSFSLRAKSSSEDENKGRTQIAKDEFDLFLENDGGTSTFNSLFGYWSTFFGSRDMYAAEENCELLFNLK